MHTLVSNYTVMGRMLHICNDVIVSADVYSVKRSLRQGKVKPGTAEQSMLILGTRTQECKFGPWTEASYAGNLTN